MATLGKDLAAIRQQRHLTLQDLHDATKIPPHILKAIEDDSIFSDFSENKTYIRSYVRSYAKALKLDDEPVVDALNKVEAGEYRGELLRETGIEEFPAYEPETPDRETADRIDDVGEEEEESDELQEADDMVHDHIPDTETPETEPAEEPAEERITAPPSVDSVDWADMGRRFTPLQSKSRVWIGIVIILVIGAAVVFFWIYQNNPDLLSSTEIEPESSQNLSQPGAVPDSLQLNLSNTEVSNTSSFTDNSGTQLQALPDTLDMLIYAAYGKLEPVRVYTDVMGSLNPYWIENGEAFRFEFVNIIRIRGQYSRMELIVNGHPIQDFRQRFYDPDTSMVVIERELFENDDRWLQPPPSSTELDFIPPTIVQDRPIFN